MEKVFQRSVIKRFDLEKFVRGWFFENMVPFTVSGDVFMSMVGALFLAGDVMGFFLVYKFIAFIMKDKKPNMHKMQQGPGITQIDQIFNRLALLHPTQNEVCSEKGKITLILSFDARSKKAIKDKVDVEVPTTLAVCSKSFAKHAQKDLYEMACRNLAKLGLSAHMAKKWKSDMDLNSPSMQSWKEALDAYITANDFSYLYKMPVKCSGEDHLYFVRIFGVRKDSARSSQLLFIVWTSVCTEYSGRDAFSKMFPRVSTEFSRSLDAEVTQYMASLKIVQSDKKNLQGTQWVRSC